MSESESEYSNSEKPVSELVELEVFSQSLPIGYAEWELENSEKAVSESTNYKKVGVEITKK